MDKTTELTARIQRYEAQAMNLESEVDAFRVEDRLSYNVMLDLMEQARKFQAEIRTFFEPMKKAAHAAHRTICQKETETLAPYVAAEKFSKGKAGKWFLEEKARADEVARKEREKLEAEEAAKKAERVEKLKEVGEPEAAERVEEREVEVAPVKAVNQAAGAGFAMIDNWKARVVDESKVPREYMVPCTFKLAKLAKANKGKDAPAGVEFYNEPYGAKRANTR